MSEIKMVLGKKYKVSHGIGTYIGYETFIDNGMKSEIVKKAPPENCDVRRVFELEPGHTWCHSKGKTPLYYTWKRYIEDVDL